MPHNDNSPSHEVGACMVGDCSVDDNRDAMGVRIPLKENKHSPRQSEDNSQRILRKHLASRELPTRESLSTEQETPPKKPTKGINDAVRVVVEASVSCRPPGTDGIQWEPRSVKYSSCPIWSLAMVSQCFDERLFFNGVVSRASSLGEKATPPGRMG